MNRRTSALVLAALLAACAGCSATSTANPSVSTPPSTGATAQTTTVPAGTRGGPPAVAGLVWHAAGSVVNGRHATYLASTRHGTIGLMWMDPSVISFRYVPGSSYPEHGPILPQDRLVSSWEPTMVAAFNGAFKLSDGDGGYYYAGVTVSRLRTGLASMVVTNDGRLSVQVWGRGSTDLANVQVVRQNLPPLVDRYVSQTSTWDSNHTWGYADHNAAQANRSALGELADGSLVYVYGNTVRPPDMAAALVLVHAQTGIMLDMNLSQPGGFVYEHVGGKVTGQRILWSIFHNQTVYLMWYKKDFVVALARS
jgi:hypothetical protein